MALHRWCGDWQKKLSSQPASYTIFSKMEQMLSVLTGTWKSGTLYLVVVTLILSCHSSLSKVYISLYQYNSSRSEVLHWASNYALNRVAMLLLVFGANPCSENDQQATPLDTRATLDLVDLFKQTQMELSRTRENIIDIRTQGKLIWNPQPKRSKIVCDVCRLIQSESKLITCHDCGIAVHLSCYELISYIEDSPLRLTEWFCDACLFRCGRTDLLPTKLRCALCPNLGGWLWYMFVFVCVCLCLFVFVCVCLFVLFVFGWFAAQFWFVCFFFLCGSIVHTFRTKMYLLSNCTCFR